MSPAGALPPHPWMSVVASSITWGPRILPSSFGRGFGARAVGAGYLESWVLGWVGGIW
ncbi:hypothetical protein BN12_2840001 [Nostocoides japonicum T1-X7]|uniref:Uncharacterized protein n=1 Tax=Nostocoides japonicum T1-X7 TaxID=1194083 RepID=A0A077LWT6_9MICO|nr:hypothetical protein BN12_2840001 [Tetrasphaera japonica T1-X7]